MSDAGEYLGLPILPTELRRLDAICSLGARGFQDKTVSSKWTEFDHWVWAIGKRETEWVLSNPPESK